MISAQLKLDRLRDGDQLRSELSTACESKSPLGWSNASLNSLLDMADLSKDQRDPLALKQQLTELHSELSSLKLKQRKTVLTALEAQLQAAKRHELPARLHVDEPPPPAASAVVARPHASPSDAPPGPPRLPREGVGVGFRWAQSEADLTLILPVPDGTSKGDVQLQLTPRHGPATTIELRARFWPVPLLRAELYAQVEASETMWHQGASE